MHICVLLGHTCEGHRTRYGSHFSPFSTEVLELELRLLYLGASTFNCYAISPAPKSNVLNTVVPLSCSLATPSFFPFLFLPSFPHPFSFYKSSFHLFSPPFYLLLVTYPINTSSSLLFWFFPLILPYSNYLATDEYSKDNMPEALAQHLWMFAIPH